MWAFKCSDCVYVLLQILQIWSLRPSWTVLMWWRRWDFWKYAFEHKSHIKFFFSWCVDVMWYSKFVSKLKFWSHSWHLKFFTPSWINFIWLFKLPLVAKSFLQVWHLNSLILLWAVLMWFFKIYKAWNDLSHLLQWGFFTRSWILIISDETIITNKDIV